MKKGLFITLVLSIALLATSAFSFAPVLKQLPDVVIGDADDPGFWTADVNLFRFSDAFAFDDYIDNDEQTTPSILKWCFVEDPLTSGALEVNGIISLDPRYEDPAAPGAKDLRGVAATANFRDIGASPHSFDAAVLAGSDIYPGSPLVDELITLYVSETVENKSDSDTINVKSVDGDIDHLAGATRVEDYSFDSGQGWSPLGATGYSLPTSSGPDGQIGLTGPVGGLVFGFWQTGDSVITYEDKIFRARYFLSRGAIVAADDMPQVRLRWITPTFACTGDLTIGSNGSFSNIPPQLPAVQEYASYLYPTYDTGGLGLAFDMLDFSPEAGLVSLDKIIVETIDRSLLGTPTAVQSYDTNFNTWEFNLNFGGAFTAVSSTGSGTDRIALTSTVAGSEAGFAQTPADATLYTAAKLYRATFDVSRTGAAANATPWIRLRAFSEDNQISAAFNILHGTDDGGAAPQTPTTGAFEIYWETPILPGSPGTGEDGFRCAFDLLDFAPTEGDTMRLESLTVESFAIPANTGP